MPSSTVRVGSAAENPKYAGLRGRLRFVLSPTMLLEIVSTVNLFVGILATALGGAFRKDDKAPLSDPAEHLLEFSAGISSTDKDSPPRPGSRDAPA